MRDGSERMGTKWAARLAIAALLAAGAVSASGCGGEGATGTATGGTAETGGSGTPAGPLGGKVTADGSSTVFPITEAVAEEFGKLHATKVTAGISGTGGGFKKFCTGETDVQDASRPIKPTEVDLCAKNGIEYVELPIAYDGLAIVVNPKNTWVNYLTVAELKTMWAPEAQGKVMKWSAIRPGFPDKELHLFGAGVDSGTYDYFTEAVVGKEHASRGDFTSSEDDNVLVTGIANDELALGFFGFAYYKANEAKLKVVPVDDGKPENGAAPVTPSVASVRDGTYQPLSRPLFIYVSKKSLERPEVDAFIDFYLKNGPALVAETGYVALPDKAYELALARAKARKTGSLFGGGGSKVGVSIEALLAAEGSGGAVATGAPGTGAPATAASPATPRSGGEIPPIP